MKTGRAATKSRGEHSTAQLSIHPPTTLENQRITPVNIAKNAVPVERGFSQMA